jgi:hypothetical protein
MPAEQHGEVGAAVVLLQFVPSEHVIRLDAGFRNAIGRAGSRRPRAVAAPNRAITS